MQLQNKEKEIVPLFNQSSTSMLNQKRKIKILSICLIYFDKFYHNYYYILLAIID